MTACQAVLFDFNGVIINDEKIHRDLINEVIIGENLRPVVGEYERFCLGKNDRTCLKELLADRGRVLSREYLQKLVNIKSQAYKQKIANLETLPIYGDIPSVMTRMYRQGLKMAIVTGALREEVELVLERAQLMSYISLIVSTDETGISKPSPDCYFEAVAQLGLKPENCLAIEDSFPGIIAAKSAGIQVVGVANTYPLHLLQRWSNWAVDELSQLEWDRVEQVMLIKSQIVS